MIATGSPFELSVVVASIDAARSIVPCVQRLQTATAGLRAELIICDASTDGSAARIDALGRSGRLLRFSPGTLAPALWAEGLQRSQGRVVALTTGHCLVSPGWARALMQGLDAGAVGAGGPLVLAPDTGPLDWAVFYLRYSAFLPETIGAGRIAGEIAGDNAAYVREALVRHERSYVDGFWEVDVHRQLRAEGESLAAVPDAVVEFGRSFRFRTIMRHRFAHGRRFGAARARGGSHPAWLIVLASPVVPLVLAARAGRRVFGASRGRSRFVASLPWLLVIAIAWAAGEAWGAVTTST